MNKLEYSRRNGTQKIRITSECVAVFCFITTLLSIFVSFNWSSVRRRKLADNIFCICYLNSRKTRATNASYLFLFELVLCARNLVRRDLFRKYCSYSKSIGSQLGFCVKKIVSIFHILIRQNLGYGWNFTKN